VEKENILSQAEMRIHQLISLLHLPLEFIKGYIKKRISISRERRKKSLILKRKKNLKPALSILMPNPQREYLENFLMEAPRIWNKCKGNNPLAHSTNSSKIRLST
jgi:hypothetical protein